MSTTSEPYIGATRPCDRYVRRERRAYETVNYVLQEFGSRLCAAGQLDEHALTRALTVAAKHIEANLFTGEAGRTTPLFESLVPKLGDLVLVNNIFSSIYFIGTLTAGFASSLPNYKESYIPIGPRLGTAAVQGYDWGRRFQRESIRESRCLQNAGSHRGLAEAYGYWLFDFSQGFQAPPRLDI